ncbi:MAG TPA: uroporphyrinogen-III synthase [Gaiellaceae bacterium]|nr:uroporphyrinogen-III synthase [Gaiellaceae bacterium]
MRVVVTREDVAARVEALGHTAVFCELIRTEALGDEPIDASGYDWLIVTSPTGARELERRGFIAKRIAAIGPGTAQALRDEPDLVARVHTQEGLRDELPPGRWLLAAAEGARQDVLDADFLPLYRTIEFPQEVDADVALLMSGSAARALRTQLRVIAIGPETADEARRVGHEVVAVADPHTVGGLVEALASLE